MNTEETAAEATESKPRPTLLKAMDERLRNLCTSASLAADDLRCVNARIMGTNTSLESPMFKEPTETDHATVLSARFEYLETCIKRIEEEVTISRRIG